MISSSEVTELPVHLNLEATLETTPGDTTHNETVVHTAIATSNAQPSNSRVYRVNLKIALIRRILRLQSRSIGLTLPGNLVSVSTI
jgi:hypothetical protein